jgi:hypothetical protein
MLLLPPLHGCIGADGAKLFAIIESYLRLPSLDKAGAELFVGISYLHLQEIAVPVDDLADPGLKQAFISDVIAYELINFYLLSALQE